MKSKELKSLDKIQLPEESREHLEATAKRVEGLRSGLTELSLQLNKQLTDLWKTIRAVAPETEGWQASYDRKENTVTLKYKE